MDIKTKLEKRSEAKCELCGNTEDLSVYEVPPNSKGTEEDTVLLCSICLEQMDNPGKEDVNHWRCLNDSMWSDVPAIKVLSWRMLHRLKGEGWPQDLLDMFYIEEDVLEWAKLTNDHLSDDEKIIHKDVNGVRLNAGDSVVLIKDLKVKGGGFTAKRGTAVRRISLDMNNEKYIEGKVEGQHIVIITDYVKKM